MASSRTVSRRSGGRSRRHSATKSRRRSRIHSTAKSRRRSKRRSSGSLRRATLVTNKRRLELEKAQNKVKSTLRSLRTAQRLAKSRKRRYKSARAVSARIGRGR